MNSHFSLAPQEASTIAHQVDQITLGLLIVSGLILILVFGLIITFSILYRQGSPHSRKSRTKSGNLLLEWGWTIATFFAFLGLFFWGALTYFQMHQLPEHYSEITVIGKQWMWKFQHPNGKREIDELHVPIGQTILLTMTSQDVIHSFFVPEFRIKQDVLPGRYTRIWFEANRAGEYLLLCTQYCGTMHAGMRGKVIVMEQSDYQRWLESGMTADGNLGGTLSMASRGGRLFTKMGCISCHGEQPGAQAGVRAPSLYGLYGKQVGLSDGTQVIADENYIRESILNPKAKITQGYAPIMPSFTGLLSEEDVLDLIAYVKSLGGTPMSGPGESK